MSQRSAGADVTEAWSFHRLLLVGTFAATLVFGFRYLLLLQAGTGIFATDFAVFYDALGVFDHWPPALPYHGEEGERFMREGGSYHPYLNPPFLLIMLWPLRFLSYPAALAVFYGVQIAAWLSVLYAPAVKALWPELPRLPRGRYFASCVILSLPFALITMLSGQAGLLYASVMLLGTSLLTSRPVYAGIVLGFLACKPTLAPMAAILMITGRQWRAFFAFVASTAALVLLATLLWGAQVWSAWSASMQVQVNILRMEAIPAEISQQLVSIYGALRMAGAGSGTALFVQGAGSAAAAVALAWLVVRKGITAQTLMASYTAVFMTTAYVSQYDMVILSAVALFFLNRHYTQQLPATTRLVLIMCCFSSVVVPQLQALGVPLGAACMVLLWWYSLKTGKTA